MIPLHKLESLPRSQRLRKVAKILMEAELRTVSKDRFTGWIELDYLVKVAKMLAQDGDFVEAAKQSISEAAADLASSLATSSASQIGTPRRPLNSLRHIVNNEIGLQIADWDLLDDSGALSRESRLAFSGVRIFLEDIRSPYNVGSMFRTAESFGVEKILVSPLCASPDHPRAHRSAMGCVALVPWEQAELGKVSGTVFALETGGSPVDEFSFPEQGIMLVGSEELGVSPAALALADASAGRVSIPTYGAKGSLNVAVAFGIAMRAWSNRFISESVCSPERNLPRNG
jgi:TrmH family RNA methyltransferase